MVYNEKGDEKREHSAKKINMQRNFISQVNVKRVTHYLFAGSVEFMTVLKVMHVFPANLRAQCPLGQASEPSPTVAFSTLGIFK